MNWQGEEMYQSVFFAVLFGGIASSSLPCLWVDADGEYAFVL